MLDPVSDYSHFIVHSRPRLDLLPASLDAEVLPMLDSQAVSRELRLRDKLLPAQDHYDYCVIDTPPALNVPTLNGLVASDMVIIPIESSLFALLGLTQLLRVVAQVRQAHAPDQFVMALSTIHAQRQNLDKHVRARVIERFSEEFVFETVIPRAVSVGEATAGLQAIVEVEQTHPATFAFYKLIAEIRGLLGDEERATATHKRRAQ